MKKKADNKLPRRAPSTEVTAEARLWVNYRKCFDCKVWKPLKEFDETNDVCTDCLNIDWLFD